MSKAIPFTQIHEDLLFESSNKLEVISHVVGRNSQAIDRLSHVVDRLGQSVERNSEDIHRLGILMEDHKSAIDTVLEVVTHTATKLRRQDEMDANDRKS